MGGICAMTISNCFPYGSKVIYVYENDIIHQVYANRQVSLFSGFIIFFVTMIL